MRSIFTPRIVALGIAGIVAGGCAVSSLDAQNSTDSADGGTNFAESTGFGATDAAADAGSGLFGSRLCAVSPERCLPDDDGTGASEAWSACGERLPDGGADAKGDDDAGPPPPIRACRLMKMDTVAPFCRDTANPEGVDGAECATGADCARGFDCVDGEKHPVCRRYCCSGSCEGQSSRNGGPTFCDIQKPVDISSILAPFCMPIKTCELLQQGACEEKETCAIVTERGDTGCVPKGQAKVGEPCDEEHCAADLTCLGSTNNRRCYQLCRTDGAACGGGQVCKTGAVFQDPTFGVCKEETP